MTARTSQQNKAINLYCRQLAEALDAAGYSVMEVMRHDAEIPWSEELAKDLLWRTVQRAMFGKESTTELDKQEVSEVYEVVNRHIAQTKGVSVPFPSEDSRDAERNVA